ncbi:MAG: lipoate--protein ligase [Clostridiales bacterium]|jgi:lipoate-protein ligase A|nr:lipoate--protein ligase [Clostridiales bacterium]
MLYYEPQSTNPHFNLALEQHLFDTAYARHVFMLWQNDNAIIIGKNQNTEAEINRQFVEQKGIKVARRLSGGGAVYHDMGNLNFTFIVPDGDDINFQFFCRPVMQTLAQFGVTAEIRGRNDITIKGKKFSGNAQYRKSGRVMHHGTIMFDSDLETLQAALSPPAAKLQSKGVASVRSRVTNISEHLEGGITLADFKSALAKNVLPRDFEIYMPDDADTAAITQLHDELYSTWQWNFGASPRYAAQKKRRVENCGTLEFYLDINQGKITGIECYGDYFGDRPVSQLASLLHGCQLRPEAIAAAIAHIDLGEYFYNLPKEIFIEILCEQGDANELADFNRNVK